MPNWNLKNSVELHWCRIRQVFLHKMNDYLIVINTIIIKNAAQVPPSYAVTYWDDEKNFYNYDTNTCSDSECGHYTQVRQLLLIDGWMFMQGV